MKAVDLFGGFGGFTAGDRERGASAGGHSCGVGGEGGSMTPDDARRLAKLHRELAAEYERIAASGAQPDPPPDEEPTVTKLDRARLRKTLERQGFPMRRKRR